MYATTNYTKENITIRNFGINEEGNPSLEVQGQAGKFIPDGDEDFFACVFYTDKGIFAVTVAAGEDENVRYFKIAISLALGSDDIREMPKTKDALNELYKTEADTNNETH